MNKGSVIITGASYGIGYATAIYLSHLGYHVIGIARHQPEKFPGDFYVQDLANEDLSQALFEKINQENAIAYVVNNVATAIPSPLGKIKPADLQTTVNLTWRPALQTTQVFLPKMLNNKFGRIVNVSSRAALGSVMFSTYAAVKAGLIALTKSWALELAQTGITVNAVAPGPTSTESLLAFAPKGSEMEEKMLKKIPMGRFGEPKEIAAAIAFFLSEDTGFITGQTLFIDGGVSIGGMKP